MNKMHSIALSRFAALLVLMLFLVPVVACQGDEEPVSLVPTDTTPPQPVVEAGATVPVVLEDNSIGVQTDSIPAGPVVFTVSNAGSEVHSFRIEGAGEGGVQVALGTNLAANETATMEAVLTAGSHRLYCPLHPDAAGESKTLEVVTP